MANSIKINNWRLYGSYRIVVIAIFAILTTFGPFSQTILSAQTTACKCCNPCKHCCISLKSSNLDEFSEKCGCEVSETPSVPQLPLGINYEQVSGSDIYFYATELKPHIFIHDNYNTIHKSIDYSIGLKAPPLYLINSSFLI